MPVRSLMVAVAVLAVIPSCGRPGTGPPESKSFPARVLLVRHAEDPKDDGSDGLSPAGRERAAALPSLFVRSEARPDPFPAPDVILAARSSKRSRRPAETVAPLARERGLKVDERFDDDETRATARELLGGGKYAGKTVLVCWRHARLPALAAALGADAPRDWGGKVFDRVWEITYDAAGRARFEDLPQRLLPGDSAR